MVALSPDIGYNYFAKSGNYGEMRARQMLRDAFYLVYTKFKVHFYQSLYTGTLAHRPGLHARITLNFLKNIDSQASSSPIKPESPEVVISVGVLYF